MAEKKRTMMPNVEQMKAAAAMATDPAVDPVVLATALALAHGAPWTALQNAIEGLTTPECMLALARRWRPSESTSSETRVAMAEALAALNRAVPT